MTARTRGAGARAKAHQPAAAAAAGAQAAAAPPANDTASQAAAAQVDEMGRQQPGTFDRTAFIAAVKRAIDAAAPKNLEEADEFAESGKAGKVKDEVAGLVKGGKQASEKDIKTATTAPPDTSKAKVKPVAPMVHDEPGPPPPDVGAAAAMPPPRPAQETDLSAGPARIDGQMAEAGITDEQIARSNEPDFTASLQARDQAREHSAQAPVAYRAQEQEQLASAQGAAQAAAGAQLEAIRGTRVEALAKVMGQKTGAKSADEAKRAKVANDVQAIYERTKTAVTGILDALDGKVEAAFSEGEGIARKQFEDFVGARMRAYKDDRYGGWGGGVLWAKDKVFGMPDEVNVFYEQGRAAYLAAMDVVIGNVATIVGAELTAARSRIAEGRAEVHTYVSELEPGLREIGKEAESRLESQFDGLSSDVDAKQDELVDSLARKYVESRDALNARIDEMKAANRGLVDKAMDAVVGVVTTILKLKDMLLSVLSKAADVIGDIIADPIGFLGKLVDGVKGGLERFVSRIGTHLENALLDWLFGALGAAGITMPKTLDFAGILDLVLQVLGLTYQSIRARVVNAVGEPIVARMEQTVDVFKTLATEGIAGLWKWIQERVSDLEDLVLGKIKDFVIERVIKGGITWIISLLNPAAAFIKACKAIYDIVMWIVERGSQLMEFVNSVLDSIGAIAKGNLGAVASKVEDSLAKALPTAISFLASLLGLGGISEKIREVIDTVRSPINKAIDFVVTGAVKGFKKMFGGAVGWAKGKLDKGKAWVKGKVEAGKAFVKGKVASAGAWLRRKFGFAMDGERHELTIEEGPPPQIVMSSVRGHLIAKLQAEARLVESNPDQLAEVTHLLTVVERTTDDLLQSQNPSDFREVEVLTGLMAAYGNRWKVRDIGVERRGDEDEALLMKQALDARTRAIAALAALPKSKSEGKAFAVAGSLQRLSGWGSLDGTEDEQQRAFETKQGVFEVGDRIRRAAWTGTETVTGPDGKPEERPLLPAGPEEDLDAAFDRWVLGEEDEPPAKAAGGGSSPVRAVRSVKGMKASEQRRLLLEQGFYSYAFTDEHGREWTREVRVAPASQPAASGGAFFPVASPFEGGEAGKYATSHAEQQVHRLAEGVPIGIAGTTDRTQVVCGECRDYFRSEARRLNKTLVIAERGGVLLFKANLSVEHRPG